MKEAESALTFGQWLGKTLEQKRMGVQEFYQRGRISRAAVYHYLNDRRVPDESSIKQIAFALGLEVSDMPPVERKKPGRPAKAPGLKAA